MVFGTLLGWLAITIPIAIVLGILALIFGVMGRRRAASNPSIGRRGMAVAGVILGIIGIVTSLGWAIAIAAFIDDVNDGINTEELDQQLEELEEQAQ